MLKKSCKLLTSILLIGLSLNQTPLWKNNVKAAGGEHRKNNTNQAQTIEVFLLIPEENGNSAKIAAHNININIPLKLSLSFFYLKEPFYLDCIKGELDINKTPSQLNLSNKDYICLCKRQFYFKAWKKIVNDYADFSENISPQISLKTKLEFKRLQDLRIMRYDSSVKRKRIFRVLETHVSQNRPSPKTNTIIPNKIDAPSCEPLPILWE